MPQDEPSDSSLAKVVDPTKLEIKLTGFRTVELIFQVPLGSKYCYGWARHFADRPHAAEPVKLTCDAALVGENRKHTLKVPTSGVFHIFVQVEFEGNIFQSWKNLKLPANVLES